MDETPKCRRCDLAMEGGWLAENFSRGGRQSSHHVEPTVWVSGEPLVYVDRFNQPTGDGYAIPPDQRLLPTKSYRCSQCGLLEIYAL
jgi:hypothetical protein